MVGTAYLSPEPGAFCAHDISALELLAGFIATSLINAAAHKEETERALHDPLTGLPLAPLVRAWASG